MFTTRRIRSVPASGASVIVRSPPSAIRRASAGPIASTRSDEGLNVAALPPRWRR